MTLDHQGLPAAVYKSVDRLRRQADEYQFGDGDDAVTVETLGTPTIADAGNLTERFGYNFQTTFQTGISIYIFNYPIKKSLRFSSRFYF